jgi:hypothetical protein
LPHFIFLHPAHAICAPLCKAVESWGHPLTTDGEERQRRGSKWSGRSFWSARDWTKAEDVGHTPHPSARLGPLDSLPLLRTTTTAAPPRVCGGCAGHLGTRVGKRGGDTCSCVCACVRAGVGGRRRAREVGWGTGDGGHGVSSPAAPQQQQRGVRARAPVEDEPGADMSVCGGARGAGLSRPTTSDTPVRSPLSPVRKGTPPHEPSSPHLRLATCQREAGRLVAGLSWPRSLCARTRV